MGIRKTKQKKESKPDILPQNNRILSTSDDLKKKNVDSSRKLLAGRKRIILKIARIVFLWIPFCLISLIIIVFIAAKIYLSPQKVEQLAAEQFSAISNGSLSMKVKVFDPYSDIWIEDIVIKNPAEFGGNFLEVQKVRIRYGFFSLLTGNVHFDEIGIYKPRVYLVQKKGVWNVDRLMKPGQPKPKETEKDESPAQTEISLPISVQLLLNFILDDLRVKIQGESVSGGIFGINFSAKIIVPPFKKIPLSPKAVTLLKEMSVLLNPDDRLDFSLYSPDVTVEPPLILGWSLLFDKGDGTASKFNSRLKFGTNKTPIRFKKSHLAPLDFLVSYDLYFDPVKDFVKLNDFSVLFKNKHWLKLEGSIAQASKKPDINIRMTRSDIVLTDLYPYYRAITGDEKMRFGGLISLAPFSIIGTPDSLAVKGSVSLTSIEVKMPDFELSLPNGSIGYGLQKNGSRGKISASVSMPDFVFVLDRGRSGLNGFSFVCDIDAEENFSVFDIKSATLKYYNPQTKEDAFRAVIRGSVSTDSQIKGKIAVHNLYFMKGPLLQMLPDALRKTIAGIPLKKECTGSINSEFVLGVKTDAQIQALFKIPDFGIDDLALKADVQQDPGAKKITVRSVSVASPSRGLTLGMKGFVEMKKEPISDSDLTLSLTVDYPKMKTVAGGLQLEGRVNMSARMKGDTSTGKARGSFTVTNMSLKNTESMLAVNSLNLNFPFEYDFAYKPEGGSRIAVDKSSIIDSSLFSEKENLSIASIAAKHPARNEQWTYVKDVKGTLFFKNNAFEIQNLSGRVLEGSLLMKDTFFYLSDLNIHNMEYNFAFDLTNVDIGTLDETGSASKDRNAELSMNARLYGRDLDIKRNLKLNGSVNIFKIGDKFANKLMKGLSEEKGKSKLGIAQPAVDYGSLPRAFNYYVDDGIMYVDVYFKSKVLGFLFGVKDNHIRFDRVPVKEYIKSIME
jgi:AsmA family